MLMTVSFEATLLPNGYDLNALTRPGVYAVTDPENGPDTGDWYVHVFVAKFSGKARQFQLAWSDVGNTGSTRSFTGTTGWTAWSNVNSGGAADLSNINDLKFDITPTDPVTGEGATYWDAVNHTLVIRTDVTDVIQQVGQEQLIRVFNDTGATLTDGTPVYVSGADASEGRLEVAPAQADDLATARVIGVVTADIADQAHGYVCAIGRVNNIDTSSFSAGALLYLDAASPGGFTATRPSYPNTVVEVGYVVISNATTGAIYVNPHDPEEQEPFDLPADITASTLTGNNNNWNPTGLATANVVRVQSDADGRQISGMQTGAEGRVVALVNIGANTVVLTDEDTNSTAANRFDLGAQYTLQAGAGVILWYDSTSSRWRPLVGRPSDFQNVVLETFTASGTWTKDAGLVAATVIVVGGGGAGGGAAATGANEASCGAGGSAGGIAIESFAAGDLGATETVTIGAAGAGASGTTGGNGGTSSFGALCSATGGAGGTTTTAGAGIAHAFPGSAGVGSGGDLNIRGSQGGIGEAEDGGSIYGGRGADSEYGGGGEITDATGNGSAGQGYGSGGSGAVNGSSQTAKTGGDGTAGIVIVAEYY